MFAVVRIEEAMQQSVYQTCDVDFDAWGGGQSVGGYLYICMSSKWLVGALQRLLFSMSDCRFRTIDLRK